MAKYAKVLIRRDSTLNWYAANPKLALGEIGVDMNLLRLKVGNGIDKWRELPYINDDLYKTHDKDKQAILDKISDILEEIEANRITAERKINAVDSRVTVLETRQETYERELKEDLQEALDKLDEGLADFATTKDELTTRMDVIVGSATGDTEILDARVDAEYNVHPNLGHNIRAIHEKLLNTSTQSEQSASDIEYLKGQVKSQAEDFENVTQALQEQININSQGIAENSLAVHDEAETRRKRVSELEKSIQSEKQQRISEDNFLQFEIDRLTDDLISEEEQRETQDKNLAQQSSILEDEIKNRMQDSEELAKQANENAEANLQNSLNISEADKRRKSDLFREERQRIEQDEVLQSQVEENATAGLENSLALHNEANQRREADKNLDEKINAEISEREILSDALDTEIETRINENILISKTIRDVNRKLSEAIEAESNERIESDKGLAIQANENAEANLQNSLNIVDADKRRKADLIREEKQRIEHDEVLQEQVNENSYAGLQNAINIHQETEARRKNFAEAEKRLDILATENEERKSEIQSEKAERIEKDTKLDKALDAESQARIEDDKYQEDQNDEVSQAVIQTNLNVKESNKNRKADLLREESKRIAGDETLQGEIDNTATASLENTKAIHEEAEKRRELKEFLRAEIQNEIQQEDKIRSENDIGLVKQVNENAEANLQNSLNISEADKRRKSDLFREERQRIEQNEVLQSQVEENATAGLENALALQAETEERRKIGKRIENLENESENGKAQDIYHQTQLDELVNAVMQSALNLRNEIEHRRKSITSEIQSYSEKENILQAEIDKTATAIIENALSIKNSNEKRRSEDSQERYSRVEQDNGLQTQINILAETCLRIMLNDSETRAKLIEVAESISGSSGVAEDEEVDEILDEIYH